VGSVPSITHRRRPADCRAVGDVGRRTNHLRTARLFQRFKFRTANIKYPARENFRSLEYDPDF
jgi:hypothetical protein